MSKHYNKVIIIDLLDAVDTILVFTKNLSFSEFLNDRKTRDATYEILKLWAKR